MTELVEIAENLSDGWFMWLLEKARLARTVSRKYATPQDVIATIPVSLENEP